MSREGARSTTATARWHQVPRKWRAVLVVLAAVVVIEFAISFAGAVYGTPSRSILGPASSLDTSGKGTAALAQMLEGRRHPVRQLESTLRSAVLPVPGTLFVLDPQQDMASELSTLRRYVAAGGRLVLAGKPGAGVLRGLLRTGPLPVWQAPRPGPTKLGAPAPENFAAGTVVTDQEGSWQLSAASGPLAGGARVLLGGSHGALALLANIGRGSLVLLASSSPLENANLARADNAAFALDIAGPGRTPVVFDEYDHLQTSPGTGIAGLPGHWQAALGLGLVAVLVWMLSAARRFGPPVRAERELVPPRIAHVDAVAALMSSGPPERLIAAAGPLRRSARELLCRSLGAREDASDAELWERLPSAVIAPEQVWAVLTEPRSKKDLLALGKAYVSLSGRGRYQ
jgi:hypothetical protein